ncbi:MAG: signal recognition particle-docking protein FtsY [Gammaproteobacteria bacterium]
MLGFKRRSTTESSTTPTESSTGKSWFSRLKDGLKRTRSQFTSGLADLVLGKKAIDADLLEELETRLLLADVGVNATEQIIQDLTQRINRKQVNDSEALFNALRENLLEILKTANTTEFNIDTTQVPYSILMVGINGAGKTTTIGKLACLFRKQGKTVLLAAGDTFRAAAIEQLKVWGERNQIAIVAQSQGSDSAAVIYDALESAKARRYDVLLADTAGRLHTQLHLLEELKKIKRVMQKVDNTAPQETWLVIDAGIGQNALVQAKEFHQALGLTGIILTKLDGTAKGGIIFAITQELKLPIRFIGVGEDLEDLHPFVAEEFVDALLERNNS